MDENILKLRVGIFVLIAMIILGILISLNSEGWVKQYTVYVEPTNAPGVTVGTPIRKNGILIGRVKAVTSKDDHVLLRLGINEDERVYENEICSIGNQSLLGDSVVEFITLPIDRRGEPLLDDAVVKTFALKQSPMDAAKSVTRLAPVLEETLLSVQAASNNVGEAAEEIKNLGQIVQAALEDDDSDFKQLVIELRTMAQKGDAAIDNFNRIFEHINDVVGDPEMKQQVKLMVLELPKMLQEARATLADAGETFREFRSIPDNFNEISNDLKPLTQSLGERGPEILAQVQSAVSKIDRLVSEASQLTEILRDFNESDGSLKKFLMDDEVYLSVQKSVRNIERATQQLVPLMRDARNFTDQIARRPSSIISGALNTKRSRYKGTPSQDRALYGNY